MTITIQASEFVLNTLNAAGIRYVLEDPKKALAEERERGKKYRPGSPKHQQHLARLKILEENASEQTSAPRATPIQTATLTQAQSDAAGALMALQGIDRKAAEKMIQQCTGSTADEIVTQALRRAS